MDFKRWLILLGISLAQILIFSAVMIGVNSDCGNKIVKCYDRNNNEILGQTCQQSHVECLDSNVLVWVIILASLFLLSFNFIILPRLS